VTLEIVSEEFVLAARARGERGWYILGAEILPNAWPPIIVESALRVTFAIMLGAALPSSASACIRPRPTGD
jgi:peptide/nickel transport system permease protein